MSVVSVKSLANHAWANMCYLLSLCGVERVAPMPSFISVEPADFCQLHCPECPVGNGNLGVRHEPHHHCMSLDTFRRIIEQCKGIVHTIQFFFQGEPLLNPNLPDMIRLAHDARLYTITSTNAQALTPILAEQLIQSGLDRIIVSIDGMNEDSYQAYRQGGNLNKAMQGLRYLRQAKDHLGGHTCIELQCLRLKSNEHEWALFRHCYRQLGADILTFKTAQFYNYEHGNPLMPSNPRYCRYRLGKNGLYRLAHQRRKGCLRILKGCVITVNGNVLPCCFDKGSNYIWGNIHTQSLRQIWNGEPARLFRRQVFTNRAPIAICGNCTE